MDISVLLAIVQAFDVIVSAIAKIASSHPMLSNVPAEVQAAVAKVHEAIGAFQEESPAPPASSRAKSS